VTPLEPLLRTPRFEVIPAKAAEQAVAEWVPTGMTVTVTASPVKGLDPTIELTERAARCGTTG
jgi:methylenetetrahydrofolate reductase (NADPH)